MRAAKRRPRDRQEHAELHVLRRADRAFLDERPHPHARRVVSVLEIEEALHTGTARQVAHLGGFHGVAAERLVA